MQKQSGDILAQENKIVIVVSPDLESGQIANRSAVLATGLAAQNPEIIGEDFKTADGVTFPGFTKVPIAVLKTKSVTSFLTLAENLDQVDGSILIFLKRAQGLRSYQMYKESIFESASTNLDIDAFILYGTKKVVNKITGNLPMLR